jgi:hypothetical protein
MLGDDDLGAQATEFAKRYVPLVEALRREGVPEDKAREEARITALTLMFEQEEGEECPLCGQRSR